MVETKNLASPGQDRRAELSKTGEQVMQSNPNRVEIGK